MTRKDHFHALREAYPGARLLIVSNSAGSGISDPDDCQVRTSTFMHQLSFFYLLRDFEPTLLFIQLGVGRLDFETDPSPCSSWGDSLEKKS